MGAMNAVEATCCVETPVGRMVVSATARGVSRVSFVRGGEMGMERQGEPGSSAMRDRAVAELREYFEGRRRAFTVPVDQAGTAFQLVVWERLMGIGYGQTATYGAIARDLGRVGGARAVGMANHENAVAVIVPCHRVVGSDGSLTGYAGGVEVKRWLLEHESGGALWKGVGV